MTGARLGVGAVRQEAERLGRLRIGLTVTTPMAEIRSSRCHASTIGAFDLFVEGPR